jgi:4-oxalocrotonate tautomerase
LALRDRLQYSIYCELRNKNKENVITASADVTAGAVEVKPQVPVVIIETWAGKSDEQKVKLISGITKVFEEIGVTADQVQIIIHDVPKTNWGKYGEQTSRLPP